MVTLHIADGFWPRGFDHTAPYHIMQPCITLCTYTACICTPYYKCHSLGTFLLTCQNEKKIQPRKLQLAVQSSSIKYYRYLVFYDFRTHSTSHVRLFSKQFAINPHAVLVWKRNWVNKMKLVSHRFDKTRQFLPKTVHLLNAFKRFGPLEWSTSNQGGENRKQGQKGKQSIK